MLVVLRKREYMICVWLDMVNCCHGTMVKRWGTVESAMEMDHVCLCFNVSIAPTSKTASLPQKGFGRRSVASLCRWEELDMFYWPIKMQHVAELRAKTGTNSSTIETSFWGWLLMSFDNAVGQEPGNDAVKEIRILLTIFKESFIPKNFGAQTSKFPTVWFHCCKKSWAVQSHRSSWRCFCLEESSEQEFVCQICCKWRDAWAVNVSTSIFFHGNQPLGGVTGLTSAQKSHRSCGSWGPRRSGTGQPEPSSFTGS